MAKTKTKNSQSKDTNHNTPLIIKGVDVNAFFDRWNPIYEPSKSNTQLTDENNTNNEITQTNPENSNIQETIVDTVDELVTVQDIMNDTSNKYQWFLNTHKHKIKIWAVMASYNPNNKDIHTNIVMPLYTNKPCWWCRHEFTNSPIGVPIKYITHPKYSATLKNQLKLNIHNEYDIFETVGLFCSFPCAKSYILDMRGAGVYKESSTLLLLMYYKLFGQIASIPKAPHWQLLEIYGGHLPINSFRSSFGKLSYGETSNIKKPFMYCAGIYFEERLLNS